RPTYETCGSLRQLRQARGEDPAGLAVVFTRASAFTEVSSVQRRGRRYSDCSHWLRWQGPQCRPEPAAGRGPKGWPSSSFSSIYIRRSSTERFVAHDLDMAHSALLKSCSHAPVTNSEATRGARGRPGGASSRKK